MVRKRQHLVRDFVLYISIGFAVAAVIMTAALSGFGRGWGEWITLSIFTFILFYYWLKICKSVWRRRSYWVITFLLLLAHLGFWAVVLKNVSHISVFWYYIAVTLELTAFAWFADWLEPFFHNGNLSKGAS